MPQVLAAREITLRCTKPLSLQPGGRTQYREWEATTPAGVKITLWDTHRKDRAPSDDAVDLTIGPAMGKKGGSEVVTAIKEILETIGATRLAG